MRSKTEKKRAQSDVGPGISQADSITVQPQIRPPLSTSQRMFLTQFGERVRGLRLLNGWTHKELAARASISVSYLACVEQGRRDLSAEYANRLAKAFDVPVRVLLGTPDEPMTKNGMMMARLIDKADPRITATILKFLRLLQQAMVQGEGGSAKPETARSKGRKTKAA